MSEREGQLPLLPLGGSVGEGPQLSAEPFSETALERQRHTAVRRGHPSQAWWDAMCSLSRKRAAGSGPASWQRLRVCKQQKYQRRKLGLHVGNGGPFQGGD